MRPLSLEWSWRQRAKAHAVAQRSLFRIQILRLVCQHCWPYTFSVFQFARRRYVRPADDGAYFRYRRVDSLFLCGCDCQKISQVSG